MLLVVLCVCVCVVLCVSGFFCVYQYWNLCVHRRVCVCVFHVSVCVFVRVCECMCVCVCVCVCLCGVPIFSGSIHRLVKCMSGSLSLFDILYHVAPRTLHSASLSEVSVLMDF